MREQNNPKTHFNKKIKSSKNDTKNLISKPWTLKKGIISQS